MDFATAEYRRPADLADALAELARRRWTVLAGGTDFYPARVGRPVSEPLLDISGLRALRAITRESPSYGDAVWRIGGLTTWSDLIEAGLPLALTGLVQAAREVGGVQIQNQATVGGNLCNASPAADGVPMLMALDAQVELSSRNGVRMLPLTEFAIGNRRTALRADELLTAVLIPVRSARAWSRFLKLGHRRYLVISVVMVGIALDFDEHDRLSSCGIAVGACSAAARRLPDLEAALLTTPRQLLAERADSLLNQGALSSLSPISDVRGSAHYRLQAADELIRRAIGEAGSQEAR
jgi:CO/xanthine dehydrogenase FAD-binding subunit